MASLIPLPIFVDPAEYTKRRNARIRAAGERLVSLVIEAHDQRDACTAAIVRLIEDDQGPAGLPSTSKERRLEIERHKMFRSFANLAREITQMMSEATGDWHVTRDIAGTGLNSRDVELVSAACGEPR